jgi:hypothetical protein
MSSKPPLDAQSNRARKGVFAVLTQAGIKSRDDRLELASDILDKQVNSFSELDKDDLLDLHFAMQSWKRIQDVRAANSALLDEAVMLIEARHDIDLSQFTKRIAAPLPHQEDEDDENWS